MFKKGTDRSQPTGLDAPSKAVILHEPFLVNLAESLPQSRTDRLGQAVSVNAQPLLGRAVSLLSKLQPIFHSRSQTAWSLARRHQRNLAHISLQSMESRRLRFSLVRLVRLNSPFCPVDKLAPVIGLIGVVREMAWDYSARLKNSLNVTEQRGLTSRQ